MIPQWLISKSQLDKRLESGIRKRLAIVNTISTNENIAKLCTKRLRFREALKANEKY